MMVQIWVQVRTILLAAGLAACTTLVSGCADQRGGELEEPEATSIAAPATETVPVATSTATVTVPGTAQPMGTPSPMSGAAADARSVPIELLLRPDAHARSVLYASFDDTPPEEIVVYSDTTLVKGERECGPVPFLEVFAYDPDAGQWAKVFDASEGEKALIARLEEYQEGLMCFGEWIHPLELTDFDSDGRHELLVRTLAGGGTANFTAVTVLGFEGEASELKPTKLFEAHLWKLQAVVVASERELWLDQGLWLRGSGPQMVAMLRGVVRYDAAENTLGVVDEEARLLCTEGTLVEKGAGTLTVRCDANEPGVRESLPPDFEATESFPVEMEFIVDQYTQFDPKPSVSSLDDVQIGESVRVWPATLGLQAVAGITWGWRVKDGVWDGSGAWVSPVAARVEVSTSTPAPRQVATETSVAAAGTSSPEGLVGSSIALPLVGPASCDELRELLHAALGPTSEIGYCDDEEGVGVEYRSKSRTWVVYLLATPSIEDWWAKQTASFQVLGQLGAEPCSSFWTITAALKPDLRSGDMDPYGCRKR